MSSEAMICINAEVKEVYGAATTDGLQFHIVLKGGSFDNVEFVTEELNADRSHEFMTMMMWIFGEAGVVKSSTPIGKVVRVQVASESGALLGIGHAYNNVWYYKIKQELKDVDGDHAVSG